MPNLAEEFAVNSAKADAVVARLIEVAAPRQIFLFGSFVRGDTHLDSDLDVLVVVDDSVSNPRHESVRLRHALHGIRMSMDIMVVTASHFDAHRHTPGLIYREVAEGGRMVYERPC